MRDTIVYVIGTVGAAMAAVGNLAHGQIETAWAWSAAAMFALLLALHTRDKGDGGT